MLYLIAAMTIVTAYIIGSINSSIIISRAVSGEDIRKSGSGNAGATNMLRTHGKKMGVITLVCDILKGVIAVGMAMLVETAIAGSTVYTSGSAQFGGGVYSRGVLEWIAMNLRYLAGIGVVLGHDFPVFFGFRGGKGVATSLGVLFMWNWHIALGILVFAVAVMAVTRYVSLGSVLAAAVYAVVVIIMGIASGAPNACEIVCSLALSGLLAGKHHANIKRLMNGTENKLGAKKKQ